MAQDEDLLTESFSARRKCFTIFQRITVVSNIIFALFAILLIVLGGVAVKELGEYSVFTKITIPAGLIVLGIILLGIIILGVMGSFKKSTKLLAAYFVLLFLFIICEFGVGGGAYTMKNQIPTTLDNSWASFSDVDRSNQQSYWQCCGWQNVFDNPGSNCWSFNRTNPNVTASTTGFNGTQQVQLRQVATTGNVNTTVFAQVGCLNPITNFFQSQLYAVGTVGIVFATLQLLALISSIVVFAFIKIEQRRSQDERF